MSDRRFINYRQRSQWAWLGLGLQPLGFLVMGSFTELDAGSVRGMVGLILILLSIAIMNWGIWNYAKSKGYGNAIAALSLLNAYGLLILVFLPDRSDRHR